MRVNNFEHSAQFGQLRLDDIPAYISGDHGTETRCAPNPTSTTPPLADAEAPFTQITIALPPRGYAANVGPTSTTTSAPATPTSSVPTLDASRTASCVAAAEPATDAPPVAEPSVDLSIRRVTFDLLRHEQLTIREHAMKTFASYVTKCDFKVSCWVAALSGAFFYLFQSRFSTSASPTSLSLCLYPRKRSRVMILSINASANIN